MNNDLISREALRNIMKCNLRSWGAQGVLVDEVMRTIDNAPPVESRGKWVNHRNDNGHNIADCSMCGHAMQWHDEDEDGVPRFCWFCGAKIDGVED